MNVTMFNWSIVFALMLTSLLGCKPNASKSVALQTEKQKVSYTIGQQIGQNLKQAEMDIDPHVLAASIDDAMTGKESRMTDEQMKETMQAFQKNMVAKKSAAGEASKAEGVKFLEGNKKKEGIKVTESGLQYKVVKEGKGTPPKATDTVEVHYKGRLINGSEFDSSYKRNAPATFEVGKVIPGWTEALQLMKPGAQWQLFIPSDIAYGARSMPGIPSNSVLIFDVELLKVL